MEHLSNLSWSHYKELLPLKDDNAINYYIKIAEEQNLSKRELQSRIKAKEYERLDDKIKEELCENNSLKEKIGDFILNPITINTSKEIINEKAFRMLILENITNFMKQLGNGYAFIESEYKLKLDDRNNSIDILLCNMVYNCYVVVELKVNRLRKQDIGQVEFYMNYIDRNLKTIYQNDTIGIIVSKETDKYVISYCSNPNIYNTTYKIENKKE